MTTVHLGDPAHPAPILARISSICPLCSRYIAKRWSWIVPLPEPIVPRGDGRNSADDGRAYHFDGRPIAMYPRRWCHADCRPRYDEPPRFRILRNSSNEIGYAWPQGWTGVGKYGRAEAVMCRQENLDARSEREPSAVTSEGIS